MKAFFICMLIVSALAVLFDLWAALGYTAHNHYQNRHDLLDTSRPQPDHESSQLGLTPKELATCDPYFADAYKASVFDGYRLGTGYMREQLRSFALGCLLFVTGCCGIRAVRKGERLGDRQSNRVMQPTDGRVTSSGN
jgi:hypothetical protein